MSDKKPPSIKISSKDIEPEEVESASLNLAASTLMTPRGKRSGKKAKGIVEQMAKTTKGAGFASKLEDANSLSF